MGKDDVNQTSVCSKVVKAEFSGAEVEVVASKNPCMVGVRGIVVKESVRCLYVINTANEVKNLLKQGSVFQIQVG